MAPLAASPGDLFKVPVYNFYELLRLLGPRHGSFVQGSENCFPQTDLFHTITVSDDFIGALFTSQPRTPLASQVGQMVTYSITNIPWPKVNVARFQIDAKLSNGNAIFSGTGFPTADQAVQIRSSQELSLFAPITRNVPLTGGTFHDTFTIDPATTILYWLTPFIPDQPAAPFWIEKKAENGNVVLRWHPNAEPFFYSYELFLMQGGSRGRKLSPDPLRAAMWVVTGATGNDVYGVCAVSASGIESDLIVSDVPPPPPPPFPMRAPCEQLSVQISDVEQSLLQVNSEPPSSFRDEQLRRLETLLAKLQEQFARECSGH
jgi:hypothetical protein